MQVADDSTVLGNFDGAELTHFGVTSTFFKRDGKFFARTEGPDGEPADYEITHTFGVVPLQQYLVAFPGGRYQVLSTCWDSRPAVEGGQRWFHLYPNERIASDDILHWTGPNQNWNFMCAECHSTDLKRNFDLTENRYETTWAEIDVSCEACHGPGSVHAALREDQGLQPDQGLLVALKEGPASWLIDPETGIARRDPPRSSRVQIEICARCHSRRSVVRDEYRHGKPLLDTHRLALLEERLYHADGQIEDEVYVYGSFLQSKMYQGGVTCSDCHDPHSLELHGSGNATCAGCHLASRFDSPEHHFHAVGSRGSDCVGCHMPVRTYMVVDPRYDHSFRSPRPDLSLKIGTPNACNDCHTDRTAEWAAETVARWYGPPAADAPPHFGEALYAGRRNLPEARAALEQLVRDEDSPAIARATALALLPRHAGPETLPVVTEALRDRDPLVRVGALSVVEVVEPAGRLQLAGPLLEDPIRVVRIRAARVLAAVPPELLTPDQRTALDLGLGEYRRAELTNAERPESHLNLGTLHAERREWVEAEQAYRTALSIDRSFVPAYVNLADLERVRGRDAAGERHLRKALEIEPDDGDVHHALGLLLVRRRQLPAAIAELERAAELRPELPRYSYVLAVALSDVGQSDRALVVLRAAHERHPGDREILAALEAAAPAGDRLQSVP